MKHFGRSALCIIICACLLLAAGCSLPGKIAAGSSELRVGVPSVSGVFNPFYTAGDGLLMSQMFETIQRPGGDNRLQNECGSITYEYLDDGRVKYTVSIEEGIRYSDGSYATIDDVIFYYHVLADATYDGPLSVPNAQLIEGWNAYRYDDKKYASKLDDIDFRVGTSYTKDTITADDLVKYLEGTSLAGKFDSSDLEKWEKYCKKHELTDIYEKSVKAKDYDRLLNALAKKEAEINPTAYDASDWYREKLIKSYIDKNYSNGADVTSISGISKVNDHTCTVIFSCVDINNIPSINPVLVPKSVYGAGYVKGSAEVIKNSTALPVGSGPFAFNSYSDSKGTVYLTANEYCHSGRPAFDKLLIVDLAANGIDPVDGVKSGKIDIAEAPATEALVGSVSDADVRTAITAADSVATVMFNCKKLGENLRRGLMETMDWSSAAKEQMGSYYTALYRPLSTRFGEYPETVTESMYPVDSDDAKVCFEAEGYTLKEGKLVDAEGKQLSLKAVCRADEGDILYNVFLECVASLMSAGIEVKATYISAEQFALTYPNISCDILCAPVSDGDTCDRSEYYSTGGKMNFCRISDPLLDTRLQEISRTADYGTRCALTEDMLEYVMTLAVEMPLYQQKKLTVYNLETISEASVPYDADPMGAVYTIRTLEPAE